MHDEGVDGVWQEDLKVIFFASRRRHTRFDCDWSSDVCSSDLDRDEMNDGVGRAADRGVDADSVLECLARSEEHTSELQSQSNIVCRLLLEKKSRCCFLTTCARQA